MKLYTEEQVINAIKLAQKCDSDCGGVYFDYESHDEIIQELTSIELPTDEEIEEQSIGNSTFAPSFVNGAKWMRKQLSK